MIVDNSLLSSKNVLFVLPWLPYPLSSGGHQAIFNGIKAVCKDVKVFITFPSYIPVQVSNVENFKKAIGSEVEVLPYIHPQQEIPICKKIILLLYTPLWKAKVFFRKQMLHSEEVYKEGSGDWKTIFRLPDDRFISHVLHVISEKKIDIVQCEMVEFLTSGLFLPSMVKKIFVHHELSFVKYQLILNKRKEISFKNRAELQYLKTVEHALLETFDGIVTLSSIDTNKLLDLGLRTPIFTSFAIINSSSRADLTMVYNHVISFVGPQFHTPNYDGLTWFIENCWSQLIKMDPLLKLKIIGKWEKDTVSNICSRYKRIEFVGYVDDLASELYGTTMIVPILVGSGIRMKILEAASIGIPFVSTSVGAEGIPVENGKHCFIADTPRDFIDSILKLSDNSIRNLFASNASQLINGFYSLDALRKNRLGIYQKLYRNEE